MPAELTELEKGLLVILAQARVSCHEPILEGYLTEGVGWAVQALAWRERALAGYDEWESPPEETEEESEEEQEAALRRYLRGE
jgi:hypothetical protein